MLPHLGLTIGYVRYTTDMRKDQFDDYFILGGGPNNERMERKRSRYLVTLAGGPNEQDEKTEKFYSGGTEHVRARFLTHMEASGNGCS